MRVISRLLILVALLLLVPLPRAFGSSGPGYTPLSAGDLLLGRLASQRAVHDPRGTVRWLNAHRGAHAVLGGDSRTVEIRFGDGAQLAIVPSLERHAALALPSRLPRLPMGRAADQAPATKAAVLLPFADELNEGPNAGQTEIDTLKAAGFSVDVYRNADVSIDLLTHLADYSVVYLETHSGTLDDGDAIVDTPSTDTKQYASYLKDGTVRQALAAGSDTLYLAITAGFVEKHMGTFAASSLLYLDGCDVLHAQVFSNALQSKGVDTLITWDSHVFSGASEAAAQFMFGQLGNGASVSGALAAANAAGYGSGLGDQGIAHLGYVGDGDDTLQRALTHFTQPDTPTPTDTPTPSPTSTPTDTPTSVPVTKKACPKNATRKHGKCTCKKGYKMVHGKCKKVKKATR